VKDNAMGRFATRMGTQRARVRAPSVETPLSAPAAANRLAYPQQPFPERRGARGHRCNSIEGRGSDSSPQCPRSLPREGTNWPVFVAPAARSGAMKGNVVGRLAPRMGTRRARFRASSIETIVAVSPWRIIAHSPLSSRQRLRTGIRVPNHLFRMREAVRTRSRRVPVRFVRFRARLRTGRFSSCLKQGAGQ